MYLDDTKGPVTAVPLLRAQTIVVKQIIVERRHNFPVQ